MGVRLPVLALALMIAGAFLLPLAPASAATPATQNPVTAGPPIARPTTASCSATILQNASFKSGYTPAFGKFMPPAGCPSPWAKVVLDWTGSVAGNQFDRIGAIWLGRTEVLRTSTPEPPGQGITWHVAKDVTEYAAMLSQPQNVTAIISNSVNSVDTGVIYVTAMLTFYEASSMFPATREPNAVVPVSSTGAPGFAAPWFELNSGGTGQASVTLPKNLVSAYLEVYATPHSCDEAWYGNQTTVFAKENGLCGGTAFREVQVIIDGQLVGTVWPFPVIYTGAWNPFLWQTIPGVNAFNIPPYKINLTPFIGLIDDGLKHTVSFTVVNNFSYWRIDGNLLLFTDQASASTAGALTTYQVAAQPNELVVQTIGGFSQTVSPSTLFQCSGYGAELCVFGTTASRATSVAGYVNSSLGKSATTIKQTMSFTNVQTVNLQNGVEDLQGAEVITTMTTSVNSSGTFTQTTAVSYPISITSAFLEFTSSGRSPYFILPAAVNQTLDQNTTSSLNGKTAFSSKFSDSVRGQAVWEGNLVTGASLVTTGKTSEVYSYVDSTGGCFAHTLSASQGAVVADVVAKGC